MYHGCEIKDQDVGEGWVAKPWKLLFFAKLIMLVSVTLLVSFCVNIFVVSFVYIFSAPRFKIYCLENWLTSLKDFFFWGGGGRISFIQSLLQIIPVVPLWFCNYLSFACCVIFQLVYC